MMTLWHLPIMDSAEDERYTTMSNDVESHPKDHCGLGLSLKHLPVRTSGPTSTSSWVDGELKFAASYSIDADSKTRTTFSVVMLHDYILSYAVRIPSFNGCTTLNA